MAKRKQNKQKPNQNKQNKKVEPTEEVVEVETVEPKPEPKPEPAVASNQLSRPRYVINFIRQTDIIDISKILFGNARYSFKGTDCVIYDEIAPIVGQQLTNKQYLLKRI